MQMNLVLDAAQALTVIHVWFHVFSQPPLQIYDNDMDMTFHCVLKIQKAKCFVWLLSPAAKDCVQISSAGCFVWLLSPAAKDCVQISSAGWFDSYVVWLCVPVNGGHPAIMCVKDGVTGWLDPYMLCVGPPEVYTHKPTHTHWVYVDQWYCFVTPQFSSSHVLVHLYLSLCETRPQHRKQLVTVNNVSLFLWPLVSRLHFVHRIITVWYYSWDNCFVTLQFSSSHFWRYSICISPFFETPQYPKQLATVTNIVPVVLYTA